MIVPPNLTARLLLLGVTTLASTVIPYVIQDRPVIKFAWDQLGPRVVSRVQQRIRDRANVDDSLVPNRYDDGVQVHAEAVCILDEPATAGLVNPRDFCSRHWWTAGPIRRLCSLPIRTGRWLWTRTRWK